MAVEIPNRTLAMASITLAGGAGVLLGSSGFNVASFNRTGVGTFQITLDQLTAAFIITCSYSGLGTQGTLIITSATGLLDGAIFNAAGAAADGGVSLIVSVLPNIL